MGNRAPQKVYKEQKNIFWVTYLRYIFMVAVDQMENSRETDQKVKIAWARDKRI